MPRFFEYKPDLHYDLDAAVRNTGHKIATVGTITNDKLNLFEVTMAGEKTKLRVVDPEDPHWNCQGWVQDRLYEAYMKQAFIPVDMAWGSYVLALYEK